MLRKTEVEVNMMRRFACNSAKLDDFGHCYPLESLYCGTPRFSTVHRVARAKIVGHMLRHSSTFRELVQWNSTEKTRNISPSEASFNDLGVTLEQALVYSQDRIHWQKLCDELRQELEPLPMYEVLRSPRWKTKHTQAVKSKSSYELQFVEEGSDPFHMSEGEVHMYIDGSVRQLRGSKEQRSGAGIVLRMSGTEDKYYSIALDAGSAERAEVESLRKRWKGYLMRLKQLSYTPIRSMYGISSIILVYDGESLGITIYRMGVSLRNWIGKFERSNRWIKGVTCAK